MHPLIPKDISSDKYLFDNSSICVYNYMYIYLYVHIVSNNPSVSHTADTSAYTGEATICASRRLPSFAIANRGELACVCTTEGYSFEFKIFIVP